MKKALIFYGGWDGHTPFETAKVFETMLRKDNFEVTLADNLEILENYDDIKKYDLFVPVWTMGSMNGKQIQNISKAVAEGAGMAGCHGGMCDAFRENTEWQFMTGAQWVAHPGNSEVTYVVNLDEGNIFTEGLKDFEYTGEQYYMHVDPAVKVYASTTFPVIAGNHATNGEVKMPVIFTKKWGKGKIFYCSLGHTFRDFERKEIKTIMNRGFLWAAR